MARRGAFAVKPASTRQGKCRPQLGRRFDRHEKTWKHTSSMVAVPEVCGLGLGKTCFICINLFPKKHVLQKFVLTSLCFSILVFTVNKRFRKETDVCALSVSLSCQHYFYTCATWHTNDMMARDTTRVLLIGLA